MTKDLWISKLSMYTFNISLALGTAKLPITTAVVAAVFKHLQQEQVTCQWRLSAWLVGIELSV
jgi:hypothetical protein